jgi:hypothetical protein
MVVALPSDDVVMLDIGYAAFEIAHLARHSLIEPLSNFRGQASRCSIAVCQAAQHVKYQTPDSLEMSYY